MSETPAKNRLGNNRILEFVKTQRAVPAFAGSLIIWVVTAGIAGRGMSGTLTSSIAIGTFLFLVGIGQMFVITSGNGGIDLSVPYVMTVSAYVAASVMKGENGKFLSGILSALAVGIVVGLFNVILIEIVQMPPIIATLSVGFILQSATLVLSSKSSGIPSPPLFIKFTTGRVGTIPNMAIFGILVGILFTLLLTKTTYGRSIHGVGQSQSAARLAGLKIRRVTIFAYLICALFSSLTGFLLAGYAGGPSLTMGGTYQLGSIAVVVLGGSLISGGLSNVPGIWAASLLLTLLITLVNVSHLGAGAQNIVQGILIVLVLTVGGTKREKD
jgi:ribose transport system permease protein